MIEDVLLKLNLGLLWQKLHSTRRGLFLLACRLKIGEETRKMLHLGHSLYGAETWMIRAVDQKQLESFEMWCWRRMEKIFGPTM
jgi:hypothetical protein